MFTCELYLDDCFKKMEQLISEGRQVDAIICDVPYNIGIADWDKSFDIERALKLCYQLLKENGNIIIFQGWSEVCKTIDIMNKLFTHMNWIIWDRVKGRGASKNLVSTREDILWYCKGENATFHKQMSNIVKKTSGMGDKNGMDTRALTNVWYDIGSLVPWSPESEEGKNSNGDRHPSQKPVELMERCVKLWTSPMDTVLDFTMGTGTTGVACRNLNRNFIGIEKDNEWFSIAQRRINNTESESSDAEDDVYDGLDF